MIGRGRRSCNHRPYTRAAVGLKIGTSRGRGGRCQTQKTHPELMASPEPHRRTLSAARSPRPFLRVQLDQPTVRYARRCLTALRIPDPALPAANAFLEPAPSCERRILDPRGAASVAAARVSDPHEPPRRHRVDGLICGGSQDSIAHLASGRGAAWGSPPRVISLTSAIRHSVRPRVGMAQHRETTLPPLSGDSIGSHGSRLTGGGIGAYSAGCRPVLVAGSSGVGCAIEADLPSSRQWANAEGIDREVPVFLGARQRSRAGDTPGQGGNDVASRPKPTGSHAAPRRSHGDVSDRWRCSIRKPRSTLRPP